MKEPCLPSNAANLASSTLFSFPRKIQIQTVDRCNFSCPACPYPALDHDGPAKRLPISAIENMLQNEPFLDPRIFDLIDYLTAASDVVTSISTVTNGSALRIGQLDRLAAVPNLNLTISVNALDRDEYCSFHGVDRWDALTELLESWAGDRSFVRLSFVAESATLERAQQFHHRWQAIGYRTRLVPIMSRNGFLPIEAGRYLVRDEFEYCHYPADTLNILADGSTILCCNDWRHDVTFGNIHEHSIAEIWNSESYSKVRRATLAGTLRQESPICTHCDYPMRSAVRSVLETLDTTESLPSARRPDEFVPHSAKLRCDVDQKMIPVLVGAVDREACAVHGWVPNGAIAGLSGANVHFSFSIAREGLYSFGGLSEVWCAGILMIDRKLGDDFSGVCVVSILFDEPDRLAALIEWYESDWTMPANGQTA
jgi:radical SAM protein with 4Fe4S-binding SPASM domain